MRTQRFPSRTEAERFLIAQRFHFQGAPSRWRKAEGEHILYADVVCQGGGAVVVYSESPETPAP